MLPLLGAMEKELSLLEGIIQDIFIFEIDENEMIINFKFKISQNHSPQIIGGLVGTINEFAGRITNREPRIIVMDDIKLVFTNLEKFLIVIVVDPSYNDEQFTAIMNILFDTYLECLATFDDHDNQFVDEIAINSQFVLNFLSEEVEVQLLNGKVVSLYPYKLREVAEGRSSSILTIPGLELIGDESIQSTDQGDGLTQDKITPKQTDENVTSKGDALYKLMNKFVRTFTDALQITLVRVAFDGTLYKTTAGRLDIDIENNVYEVVTGLMDEILKLLDKSENERIIDLDDKYIFFQKINPKCFVYLTVENQGVLSLIQPLIERISTTLSSLFPEDQY